MPANTHNHRNPPGRARRAVSAIAIVFFVSWLTPLLILAAPMLARTYVHSWKVVLGIEPDCAYPAATFRWGTPDCADAPRVPATRADQPSK